MRKKYLDRAGVRIRNVNGAAGIDRDCIGFARGISLKAEQRDSRGFELLHEPGSAVDEIDAANRIHGRPGRIFKLAGVGAPNAPLLDEFDWRRFHYCRRLRVRP